MSPPQIEARDLNTGHAVVWDGERFGVVLVRRYRLFVVVTFTDGRSMRFRPDELVCIVYRQDVA